MLHSVVDSSTRRTTSLSTSHRENDLSGDTTEMIDVLPLVLTVTALVAAAWCGVLMALNKPLAINKPLTASPKLTLGTIGFAALLEIGLITQAVIGLINMIGTSREIDRLSFAGYLITPAVILPGAVLWSLAERSRYGVGVLIVGFLSIPAMILRLQQLWAGHG
jgi:hypothetical protein